MHYWPFLILTAPLLLSPLEIWARKYRGGSALALVRRAAVAMVLAIMALMLARLVRDWPDTGQEIAFAFESFLWFCLATLMLLLLLFALLQPRRHPLPTPRQFGIPPSLLLSTFLCSIFGIMATATVAEIVTGLVASQLGWERPDFMWDLSRYFPHGLSVATLLQLVAVLVCAAVSWVFISQSQCGLLRGETYRSPLLKLLLTSFVCGILFSSTREMGIFQPDATHDVFGMAVALHHYLLLIRVNWAEPYFLSDADVGESEPLASGSEAGGLSPG